MAAPLDTPIYLKERESLRIADGAGFEVKCLRSASTIGSKRYLRVTMLEYRLASSPICTAAAGNANPGGAAWGIEFLR